MSNVIVEKVARMVYLARGRSPHWDTLSDAQKGVYRAHVQEVLLAAMSAGLRIQEVAPISIRESCGPEAKCDVCGVSAALLETLEFADGIGGRRAQTLCRQCKGTPLP